MNKNHRARNEWAAQNIFGCFIENCEMLQKIVDGRLQFTNLFLFREVFVCVEILIAVRMRYNTLEDLLDKVCEGM